VDKNAAEINCDIPSLSPALKKACVQFTHPKPASGLSVAAIISIVGVLFGAVLGTAGYVYKRREHEAIMELAAAQKGQASDSKTGGVQALVKMSDGKSTIGASGYEAVMSVMKKFVGMGAKSTTNKTVSSQETHDRISV